jgi:putative membrane-bound dehydrogenase-like protein
MKIMIALIFLVGAPDAFAAPPLPTVPAEFEIEVAAEFPIVERPVMACFDELGRLFLVDSSGINEPFEKLVQNPSHRIVVIEDTDGDGKFDRRTVFADKLVMPQGVLPYRGAVYTASPPSVWKLEDTDGDGVCDKRTEILTEFGSNGNAADIHGPFLGPDGWLYLCDGRHGHKVKLADGSVDQGLAGGIFRFRTDGSGFARICGGGFDNPVEIDFTDEGEILGTVNILHVNPRQDCLMHWIEGGVYPHADQEQCIAEYKKTGDLMPAIKEFGHVAVSGMTRYRSEGFGPEYRDNLFITFFNRHKVIRSILTRSGATFTSREEEFLSSDEKDFHPTDVLEDADGSLLEINTGGWFRLGCPVSEIAKPDVMGAIYRIRKKGMKKVDDPRGLALGLEKMSAKELVGYLDDPRPAVRERAIDLLAAGDLTTGSTEILRMFADGPDGSSPRKRRHGIWAADRMLVNRSLKARTFSFEELDVDSKPIGDVIAELGQRLERLNEHHFIPRRPCWNALEAGLSDPDESVRQSAAGAADSLYESDSLFGTLQKLVLADTSSVRRAAANAIGRRYADTGSLRAKLGEELAESGLDNKEIVGLGHLENTASILFESIRKGTVDRVLEHTLIYALIRINDRERTLPFLKDTNPEVRRAALIALDQMDDGKLTRELVTPLLDTDDPQLRKTALAVIASRKGWATELVGLLRGWFAESNPSEENLSLLRGVLLAQAGDVAIQQVISEALAAEKTLPQVRLLLWEVIDRAPLAELPAAWLAAVERTLDVGSPADIRQIIAIVNQRNLAQFDGRLIAIVSDQNAVIDLQVEALAAAASRLKSFDDSQFSLLASHLKLETSPLLLLTAARGLADAPLSVSQLHELTALLSNAGPLALPVLLRAFDRADDTVVGLGLVAALEKSPAVENLSAEELAGILRKYPSSVQKEAGPLLARLGGSSLEQQQTRLKEFATLLSPSGNATQGRDVFFGKKAACANCHTIAGEGGRVGPDLTKIGASRSGTDLLEAIVFPSASFAREFRPYVIVTDAGKAYTGVITRQTADAVHLRTADLAEVRIPRSAIEEMKESNTSIMPKGLDTTLAPDELRNLLAYLQQLK